MFWRLLFVNSRNMHLFLTPRNPRYFALLLYSMPDFFPRRLPELRLMIKNRTLAREQGHLSRTWLWEWGLKSS
jgi:hypothetical protein